MGLELVRQVCLLQPEGSLMAGFPAEFRVRQMMSLMT